MWKFFERFWFEREPRKFIATFGGSLHTYKLILVKEERNNL